MEVCRPVLGLGSWRKALLLVSLSFFACTGYSQAQDVAEAARQERARKAEQSQRAPHVYTAEDLKRDQILTPEDQERAEARKKQKSPSSNNPENAEALPLAPAEPTESLGEIARRYRKETEEKEAAEAAKKKINPFPYTQPEPSFAAPEPEIAPLVRTSPEGPVLKPAEIPSFARPRVPPAADSSRVRISPFQPRPLHGTPAAPPVFVVPSVPAVPLVNARPAAGPERSVLNKTAPVIEKRGLRQIQVRQGDSWWNLAGQYLGSGARWRELRQLNPDVTEPAELLKAGSIIRVPETRSARSSPSQLTIVVKRGDTLWALARTHLGHGNAWGCLASANPQIPDFTRLAIGSVLHVPDPAVLQTCERSIYRSSSR
jgi:nucleoid-associated protein YgaU